MYLKVYVLGCTTVINLFYLTCSIGQPVMSLTGMSKELQVALQLRFEIWYLKILLLIVIQSVRPNTSDTSELNFWCVIQIELRS
jgi:hypothetical protein